MKPPRFLRSLLRRRLPPERFDEIDGDFREEMETIAAERGRRAARAWYRRQVLGVIASSRTLGGRRPLRPRFPLSGSDLAAALRVAVRQPLMSLAVVVALSVGIGMATGGYALFASIFAPLPYPAGDRMVSIFAERIRDGASMLINEDELDTLRDQATSFEGIAAYWGMRANLESEPGQLVAVEALRIEPRAFDLLPVRPVEGRLPTAAGARPGSEPVALVGADLAGRLYGEGPVTGRELTLDGVRHRVIGVLPADFGFPVNSNLWVPLVRGTVAGDARALRRLRLFGVVREGTSIAGAESQLRTLLAGIERPADADEVAYTLVPYTRSFASEGFELFVVGIMAFLVVLLCVAAANVANLVLVRAFARSGELAVRAALGATRARLVVQVFLEVLVLGAVAAAVGVFGALRALAWLDRTVDEMPYWVDFSLDARVTLVAAALAVLGSGVASVVPALRVTGGDLESSLRDANRGIAGARFGRLAGATIVAEVALAIGLLSAAGTLGSTLLDFVQAELEFPQENLLTATVYWEPPERLVDATGAVRPDDRSRSDDARRARRIERELDGMPGVVDSAVSTWLPRMEGYRRDAWLSGPDAEGHGVKVASVAPGFLDTLGIAPLAGRLLEPSDLDPGAAGVVLVTRSFADALLGGANPIGRRIRLAAPGTPRSDLAPGDGREIVGVVPSIGISPMEPDAAGVIVPLLSSNHLYVAMRTRSDPMSLETAMRARIASIDPTISVYDVLPMAQVGWETRALLGGVGTGVVLAGGAALFLSIMGIYSILAFSVVRRRREIGIRMALGARRPRLLRAILSRTVLQLGLGALLGGALALLLAAATRVLPFDIGATDPLWIAAPVLLIPLIALLACLPPTRLALRIRPMSALRSE